MINTVYELITDVMAKQYPDRVAFRYVAADGKTVVERPTPSMCRTSAGPLLILRRISPTSRQACRHHEPQLL